MGNADNADAETMDCILVVMSTLVALDQEFRSHDHGNHGRVPLQNTSPFVTSQAGLPAQRLHFEICAVFPMYGG